MFRKKPFTKGTFAVALVIVFLAGWFSFAWYLYTNQILVVSIEGPIVDFQATTLALYQGQVDRNVKTVILYLNTPGGLAYSCMEIGAYVKELAKVKPVIAVMGAEAASGGYYIASFATYIFTHENTITGGIGVIAVWVDLSEYYQKQGIRIWIWKTGEEKDFGAEWRSPTKAEIESIQSEIISLFQKLLDDIKSNRESSGKPLSAGVIDQVKAGSVFSGGTAVQMGLADEIGNIINAIEKAASMTRLWRFIVVTPYMDEKQKFLEALF